MSQTISFIGEIRDVVASTSYFEHARFLTNLIDVFESNDSALYIEKLNGVEMWGGAGAIWELELDDSDKQARLDRLIFDLLSKMDSEKILGKRAKSVYPYFKQRF
jgi:hypothetical protein